MKNTTESFPVIKSYIVLFAFAIFVSSCMNNNPASPTTVATNTPVIASAANAFTFVLAANNYTQNQNWGVTFTSDSITFSLVSGNYKSGSVLFSVTDSTTATILQDTIKTNAVVALTQTGKGVPKHCTINCSNYTGNVTFTMSGNK